MRWRAPPLLNAARLRVACHNNICRSARGMARGDGITGMPPVLLYLYFLLIFTYPLTALWRMTPRDISTVRNVVVTYGAANRGNVAFGMPVIHAEWRVNGMISMNVAARRLQTISRRHRRVTLSGASAANGGNVAIAASR